MGTKLLVLFFVLCLFYKGDAQTAVTVYPSNAFSLSNANTWQTWDGLSKAITLGATTTVLAHYQISSAAANTHFLSKLYVDGVEQQQTRSIIGNVAYGTNSGLYVGSLGAGSHTFEVKYRTPGGINMVAGGGDWQARALSIVQLGAGAPAAECCIFPKMKDGVSPFKTAWNFDAFSGIKKNAAQRLEFSVSAGDFFSFVAASPSFAFQCGSGKDIKSALGICGSLPITDASQSWNAIGFEGSPEITATLFGMKYDVLGMLQKWQEVDPKNPDKVKLETTKQKVGYIANNLPDFGDNALCFAFQSGLFAKAGCSLGFAIAQVGFLTAKCALQPATGIVCPVPAGYAGPTIDFELLNFGFSPARDLQQEALAGFWTGSGTVASAINGAKPMFNGVVSLMGTIAFNAFEFEVAGTKFVCQVTLIVAAILDLIVPSMADVKKVFREMSGGNFNNILSGVGLPKFQFTVTGTLTVDFDLKLWKINFTPGIAGLTFGFNMNDKYPGLSNGFYAGALYTATLIDLCPPLANDFFKCNGVNIFTQVSGKRAIGLYMSPTNGFGYGFEFTAAIFGNNLNFEFRVTTKHIHFAASLSLAISTYQFSIGVGLGGTWTNAFSWYFKISSAPTNMEFITAVGNACKSLWTSLLDTIKGWFGIAREEFLQWQQARVAAHKAKGVVITPRFLRNPPQSSVHEASEEFVQSLDSMSKATKAKVSSNIGSKDKKWLHLHHSHHPHAHIPVHIHHRHSPHIHHRHWPHIHAADFFNDVNAWLSNAVPSLIFEVEKSEPVLTICEISFAIGIKAGAKFFGTDYTKSYGFSVKITIGDVWNAIKTAVVNGFNTIKDTIVKAFGGELRKQYLAAEERDLQLQEKKRF